MKQFLRGFRKASDAFDQKFGWFFMNGFKSIEGEASEFPNV